MLRCVPLYAIWVCVLAGCGGALPPAGYVEAPAPVHATVWGPEKPTEPGDVWGRDLRADHVVAGIVRDVARVEDQLAHARRERDVVRTLCSTDKLTQLRAIERNARERRTALRDALLQDGDGMKEYDALVALVRTAKAARAEADQCVGQELGFVGESVATTIDADELQAEEHVYGVVDKSSRVAAKARPIMADMRSPALGAPPPVLPPMPALPPPTGAPTAAAARYEREAPHDASMLIRNADIALAVYTVDKTLAAVEAIARDEGGYLALRDDRRVTVRVPRERFEPALRRIEKLGDVLHENVTAEDVTDQYVDLDARLQNAKAVRARLETLLESAGVHDAVEIHKELAKVTEEIERLEGKLKLLRDRVGYSTLTVALQPAQPEQVRARALLPFPWLGVMGLGPLLTVPR